MIRIEGDHWAMTLSCFAVTPARRIPGAHVHPRRSQQAGRGRSCGSGRKMRFRRRLA